MIFCFDKSDILGDNLVGVLYLNQENTVYHVTPGEEYIQLSKNRDVSWCEWFILKILKGKNLRMVDEKFLKMTDKDNWEK